MQAFINPPVVLFWAIIRLILGVTQKAFIVTAQAGKQ
jgi:hypothetical protein